MRITKETLLLIALIICWFSIGITIGRNYGLENKTLHIEFDVPDSTLNETLEKYNQYDTVLIWNDNQIEIYFDL